VHDTPNNKPGDDKIYERTFYKLFDEASMKGRKKTRILFHQKMNLGFFKNYV
jgi:hypothetical protein